MLNETFGLASRAALITGAAGLLGTKHAEAILMAGGVPILTDVSAIGLERASEALENRFGVRPKSFVMDITSEDSIRSIFEQLRSQGIAVDILINNAARNPSVSKAGLKSPGRLEQLDLFDWDLDIAVGLTGAVLCSKVFGTAMAHRGRGVIVNVASDLALIAPDQRLYRTEGRNDDEQNVKPVSYSVVKHGLIGLTKYLATYWAERGVRCNAISPGGVYNGQDPHFVDRIRHLIPLGRMANADEYQGAVIFLCSEASSYMNGANLIMDGGRSVW